MRITVLANRDLASNIALNLLVQKAPQHNYTVLLSASVGTSQSRPSALQTLSFFEQTLIDQIVFPLMDNNPTHNFRLNSFNGFGQRGVKVTNVSDINSRAGLQVLAAHKPHLILSIRFGQILQQQAIDVPEFGVLNLHSGRLPDYRGVMATFWAMHNEEQSMGTTLHYIDSAKIDAGPIVAISEQAVDYQRSYLSNVLSVYPAGVDLIVDTIRCIENGARPVTQTTPAEQGNYYSFPDEKALNEFTQKGLKLVDYDEIVQFCQSYW